MTSAPIIPRSQAISYLAMVGVPCLLAFVVLELFSMLVVAKGPLDARRAARIYDPATPEVLVLGDSHFHEMSIRVGLELSSGGDTPRIIALLAREFQKTHPLSRLVVPSGPHIFAPDRIRRGLGIFEGALGQNVGLGFYFRSLEPAISRFLRDEWPLFWPWLQGKVEAGRSLFTERQREDRRRVATRQRSNRSAPLDPSAVRGLMQERLVFMRPEAAAIDSVAFDEYVAMLRDSVAAGVRVCAVRMPVMPMFRALQDAEEQFVKVGDHLRHAALEAGVTVVDAQVDLGVQWQLSDFRNADHMSREGYARIHDRLMQMCFDIPRG